MAFLIWDAVDGPDEKNEFGEFCVQELPIRCLQKGNNPTTRIIAKGNIYQTVEAKE